MFDDIHNTKRKRNDDREFYIYIIHLSTNVFVCAGVCVCVGVCSILSKSNYT